MSLFNTGVRPAIDEYLLQKAKERRDYGQYWSASSAGYCMRKNIFDRLGVPAVTEDARKQRVFTSGHIFHDWIQEITKDAGLSIAQELELQDEDLMIRGHIDDLVLMEYGKIDSPVTIKEGPSQHLILYDYKTVNSRSFLWAKKNGNAMSRYHRYQLGTYMYMIRKLQGEAVKPTELDDLPELSESRILKIEKDTLMMGEQQLLWSDELSSEINEYWTALNAYWDNKKIPPCTCADYENGFMAKEKFNPYFYDGEPCSLAWYQKFKEEAAA
jgi:hypothetical protein